MSNLKIFEWLESPEFSSLRDSNLPPSDAQRSILIEIQSRLKDELGNNAAHDSDHLQREQNLLKSIETILSPVRALPHDVLVEVFLRCLPDRHSSEDISKSAPWLLIRICSSWRSLALETPSLWTTPRVVIMGQRTIELCQLWFSHAKNLPLNFSLGIPYASTVFKDKNQYDLLIKRIMKETLLRYLHQLRHLELMASELLGPLAILNEIYTDIGEEHKMLTACDALETLTLSNVSASEDENFPWYIGEEDLRIFEHAPCLRHLVLNVANGSTPVLHLPWEMLTNLCVAFHSSSEVNRLVRKCPNLRCGSFSIVDVEDEDEDDETEGGAELQNVYILKHLHSLLIVNSSSTDLFKNIEFPVLTALFLSSRRRDTISRIETSLPQFHNLQRLALLDEFVITKEHMLTLFRSTPNLVELELKMGVNHEPLFKELTISKDDMSGNEPLLPHLQILLVEYTESYNIWTCINGIYLYTYIIISEAFAAMVQSRWKGSGNEPKPRSKCLHNVSFFTAPGQSTSILQEISNRLQSCVDEGLKLNVNRPRDAHWDARTSYRIGEWHDSLMTHRPSP